MVTKWTSIENFRDGEREAGQRLNMELVRNVIVMDRLRGESKNLT